MARLSSSATGCLQMAEGCQCVVDTTLTPGATRSPTEFASEGRQKMIQVYCLDESPNRYCHMCPRRHGHCNCTSTHRATTTSHKSADYSRKSNA
eukprot:4212610-Amphidinium_carterae.1